MTAQDFLFSLPEQNEPPALDPAEVGSLTTPAVHRWCADRGHPWVTVNPWLDRTWCRCGARQADGEQPLDWQAKHDTHHTCGDGETCRCYQ